MTEAEWLKCDDPVVAFYYMPGRPSDRKLRLFGCACVRRVWQLISNPKRRKLVEVAEDFADGLVAETALKTAYNGGRGGVSYSEGYWTANEAEITTCLPSARDAAAVARYAAQVDYKNWAVERRKQAAVFRDIVGNPFRPVHVPPDWKAWSDGTVVKLARAIYEERRFEELPILADALEEAGCTNEDMLNHCRQPGEHARGCWVLDLVLDKK